MIKISSKAETLNSGRWHKCFYEKSWLTGNFNDCQTKHLTEHDMTFP